MHSVKYNPFLSLLLVAAATLFADQVYTKNKKANSLYKNGNYGEALKLYEDLSIASPSEPKLKMNKGSAHYQLGDADKAEESYTSAQEGIKDKKVLADYYYNLGNIQYMQGEKLAAQGKQEAMDKYKAALGNYIKSLDIRPQDRDAKWNLQLASARIKEQQNQQNQNQQNKNDKNDRKNQQDQKQNKDQNKQDQQNKDDKQKEQKEKDQQNQQNNKQQDRQKPEPQPAQQKQEDIKKDEAKKLLQLYADDEQDLKKKPEKQGIAGQKRNRKDW